MALELCRYNDTDERQSHGRSRTIYSNGEVTSCATPAILRHAGAET